MKISPNRFPPLHPLGSSTWLYAASFLMAAAISAAIFRPHPTFGSGGQTTASLSNNSIHVLQSVLSPDGDIFVFGYSHDSFLLERHFPNGSVNTSFGSNGVVTNLPSGLGYSIVFQRDGMIVLAGYNTNDFGYTIVRVNQSGVKDGSFGDSGVTHLANHGVLAKVALQPDGKIVAAGSAPVAGKAQFLVSRLNVDGSVDTSFGTQGDGNIFVSFGTGFSGECHCLAIQPDGKIVLAGYQTPNDHPVGDFAVARLNANGTRDDSFGASGLARTGFPGHESDITSIVIQANGQIVTAGYVTDDGSINLSGQFALARYNTDGSLDASFGSGGRQVTDLGGAAIVYALALGPNGKIVAGGTARFGSSTNAFAVVRYNLQGVFDPCFNATSSLTATFGGNYAAVENVIVQDGGKILATGFANGATSTNYFAALVRFEPTIFEGEAGLCTKSLKSPDIFVQPLFLHKNRSYRCI